MGDEFKYEYSRPDAQACIFSREQALTEFRELKGYIDHVEVLDETSEGEYCGAVFVAIYLSDPTYDDWFTFSSKTFTDHDIALAFVTDAGCEKLLSDD